MHGWSQGVCAFAADSLQIVACTFVGTIEMDISWFAKDGAFSSFNLIQFQKGDAACH